ncbi:MAG: hypothetical protein HQ519_15115, partial [Planctomycetes bacterium]|nr:hypothetical protein [Planctomycetota bacterium]
MIRFRTHNLVLTLFLLLIASCGGGGTDSPGSGGDEQAGNSPGGGGGDGGDSGVSGGEDGGEDSDDDSGAVSLTAELSGLQQLGGELALDLDVEGTGIVTLVVSLGNQSQSIE